MSADVERGYVPVTGARLYYKAAGEGPALVFIHAGVADHRMWDEQVPVFARRYRVIRYDTRGFGRSVTEDVEYANRQDLADLLTHLRLDEAIIVGASRAGSIALDFALDHPERVTALVLVGSALGGLKHHPTEDETAAFKEMNEAWERKDFPRLTDLEIRMWVDGPGQREARVRPALRERVRAMILNTYAANATEGKPQRLDPPAAARLGEVRIPTLIILGDLDESGVHAAADRLAEGIAGSRKVVMTGTAHLPSMERPEEFNRILLDFLADLHVPH